MQVAVDIGSEVPVLSLYTSFLMCSNCVALLLIVGKIMEAGELGIGVKQ